MSWNLEGSYFETCSCELMCPCNLSLSHGATYDFCRATLVFAIREGEVDGVDIRDFEVEDIVPFGSETGRPVRFDGAVHPVAPDLTMAEARRSRINAFGIDYEGRSGASTAEFSWAA
jgi:uncharacterized protein DUF1326